MPMPPPLLLLLLLSLCLRPGASPLGSAEQNASALAAPREEALPLAALLPPLAGPTGADGDVDDDDDDGLDDAEEAGLGAGEEEAAPTPPPLPEPYFDALTPRHVTALLGRSARLTCRVFNLANRTVSWVRHRDLHILTVGAYTYSSDQRISASRVAPAEWQLEIRWVTHRDAGVYECQVSSLPIAALQVRLDVVVPTASILGGPDLFVNRGSSINLTCVVVNSPEPPAYIFWYHRDQVISYDSPRGGVSVATDKGAVTTTRLLVQRAAAADAGRYSCRPSNARADTIAVHVLDGEHPEAMQAGSTPAAPAALLLLLPLASLALRLLPGHGHCL